MTPTLELPMADRHADAAPTPPPASSPTSSSTARSTTPTPTPCPTTCVDRIGVGKRVEAPFGRGDTGTVGYCVRVHDTPPPRAVKAIARVLDDDALLDRLTCCS